MIQFIDGLPVFCTLNPAHASRHGALALTTMQAESDRWPAGRLGGVALSNSSKILGATRRVASGND